MRDHGAHRQRGAVAVLVLVSLLVMLGFSALVVDVGYMYNTRTDLQRTADAASLAGANAYFTTLDSDVASDVGIEAALSTATANPVIGVSDSIKLDNADIRYGQFLGESNTFFPGATPFDAVQVIMRRTAESANGSLDLMFAQVFGVNHADVTAEAIAKFDSVTAVSEGVPIALRVPGFDPINPESEDGDSDDDEPSNPSDEKSFKIGEEVTVFAFGNGEKAPVHLLLESDEVSDDSDLEKIVSGEAPGIPLAVGDEYRVLGEGTGHADIGSKLADRLDDDDTENDIIIVPIVEEIVDWHGKYSDESTSEQRSRDDDGHIDGHVRIVDFAAVRLDRIKVTTVSTHDHEDDDKGDGAHDEDGDGAHDEDGDGAHDEDGDGVHDEDGDEAGDHEDGHGLDDDEEGDGSDDDEDHGDEETIEIELLVGTIVRLASQGQTGEPSGVVEEPSVGLVTLVR